jgi:hypothetical protein
VRRILNMAALTVLHANLGANEQALPSFAEEQAGS